MYTSLVYNINVATSITSQGRALVSSMTLFFEAFLSNNVKYGSLNEVLESIRNIVSEGPKRKYRDRDILDKNITRKECFVKVAISCGYRWIPTKEELDIIWMAIQNLSQEDLNRVYYKNNLYEFMSNSSMRKAIRIIMTSLDKPYMNPNKPPKNIKPMLDELVEILKEFVYYRYMFIDRIDRCATMMKNVTLISDTDSTIVSLDAWYRFVLEDIKDIDMPLTKVAVPPIFKIKFDEFGDIVDGSNKAIEYFEPDYDYDFFSDELIELEHCINPTVILPQDNIRHTILNILSYVNTALVNDYMEAFCFNTHSWKPEDKRKCKIYSKNEFTFQRALLTLGMKNYATLQEVQEGALIPKDKQLDIKGIEALTKSTKSKSTREALQKVLLEDIMRAPSIDQFKIVKDLAILEKKIINSLYDGSREYYKPVTIKSINTYNDPMRIQGIKASIVWNALKDDDLPAINLDERNAIDVAKVRIDPKTIEKIRDKYPETYEKAAELIKDKSFKSGIDSIAIPLDSIIPEWLLEFIDYTTIVNDNIGGFPYESVGIKRFNRNDINYTNILSL